MAPPMFDSAQHKQLYMELLLRLAEGKLPHYSVIDTWCWQECIKAETHILLVGMKIGKVFVEASIYQKLNTMFALSKIFF